MFLSFVFCLIFWFSDSIYDAFSWQRHMRFAKTYLLLHIAVDAVNITFVRFENYGGRSCSIWSAWAFPPCLSWSKKEPSAPVKLSVSVSLVSTVAASILIKPLTEPAPKDLQRKACTCTCMRTSYSSCRSVRKSFSWRVLLAWNKILIKLIRFARLCLSYHAFWCLSISFFYFFVFLYNFFMIASRIRQKPPAKRRASMSAMCV